MRNLKAFLIVVFFIIKKLRPKREEKNKITAKTYWQ